MFLEYLKTTIETYGSAIIQVYQNLIRSQKSLEIMMYEDGLQSNELKNSQPGYKSKTGELIFGGINGFNIFYPDSIKDNPIFRHISPIFIYSMTSPRWI